MKFILSIVIFAGLAWLAFPMKLKDGQLETAMSNDRVLTNYIKCLLDQGACTREGTELKSKFFIFTQYLIDFCTSIVQSFPIKKFRHFFIFKRYVLFWTHDSVSDLYHWIVIILSAISLKSQLRITSQYTEIVYESQKPLLLLCLNAFQNSCRTLYNRIVQNAVLLRNATPEK